MKEEARPRLGGHGRGRPNEPLLAMLRRERALLGVRRADRVERLRREERAIGVPGANALAVKGVERVVVAGIVSKPAFELRRIVLRRRGTRRARSGRVGEIDLDCDLRPGLRQLGSRSMIRASSCAIRRSSAGVRGLVAGSSGVSDATGGASSARSRMTT